MAKQRRRKGKDISRTAAIIGLAVALALTVLLGYLGFNGAKLFSPYKLLPWLPTADTDNWPEALTLGLDLRGGVYIEYDATPPEGSFANEQERAKYISQSRKQADEVFNGLLNQ